MDHRLIGWARAVKSRRRRTGCWGVPVLWLFTDPARLPDPRPAVAALPRDRFRGGSRSRSGSLCGVVFRHDGTPGRAALARAVARLCRACGHALVVAGDARLARALGAGVHLRGGRWPGLVRTGLVRTGLVRTGPHVTSSAHDPAELRRAVRAGAAAVFLSPAFPTVSHEGARALGSVRWAAWALRAGWPVLALGGVDGRTAARLPRRACAGAGAIGALLP